MGVVPVLVTMAVVQPGWAPWLVLHRSRAPDLPGAGWTSCKSPRLGASDSPTSSGIRGEMHLPTPMLPCTDLHCQRRQLLLGLCRSIPAGDSSQEM